MDVSLLLLLLLIFLQALVIHRQDAFALPLHPNAYLQLTEHINVNAGINDQLRARPSNVILHRPSGLCVLRKLQEDPLNLGSCSESDSWYHTPQDLLMVKGTYFCLQAFSSGQANITIGCSPLDSEWRFIPNHGKIQLVTMLPEGFRLCLDAGDGGAIFVGRCKCLEGESKPCDLSSQWFEFADKTKLVAPVLDH